MPNHDRNTMPHTAKYSRTLANNPGSSPSQHVRFYPGLTSESPAPALTMPNNSLSLPFSSSVTSTDSPSLNSLFKGMNLDTIKSMVNRMGGIQGIIDNINKMQKLIGTFQQMAPMLKLLFTSFNGKKAQTAHLQPFEEPVSARQLRLRPKRRPSRKRSTSRNIRK